MGGQGGGCQVAGKRGSSRMKGLRSLPVSPSGQVQEGLTQRQAGHGASSPLPAVARALALRRPDRQTAAQGTCRVGGGTGETPQGKKCHRGKEGRMGWGGTLGGIPRAPGASPQARPRVRCREPGQQTQAMETGQASAALVPTPGPAGALPALGRP